MVEFLRRYYLSSKHITPIKVSYSVIRFDYSKKFGIDIPSFGGLEEYNIDKIASILPENYLDDIEIIAKEDSTTQEIIQEISSFPDMTDEQVEEQIINLEKMPKKRILSSSFTSLSAASCNTRSLKFNQLISLSI